MNVKFVQLLMQHIMVLNIILRKKIVAEHKKIFVIEFKNVLKKYSAIFQKN
jgi:hypothetical protein